MVIKGTILLMAIGGYFIINYCWISKLFIVILL
jgi:hypothetical protein